MTARGAPPRPSAVSRRAGRGRAGRVRAAGATVAVAALVGLVLTPSAVLAPAAAPATAVPATAVPATAAGPPSGSAVTVPGHGPFSGLQVTVSQTKDLINQTILVTWTGGTPTEPRNGSNFSLDFLQIMQCWGDAPSGPTREQCEFGATQGLPGSDRGGYYVSTRAAHTPFVVDPHDTTYRPTPATPTPYVPFRSVTGKTVQISGPTNEFYDSSSSNEQPFVRTYSSGSGQSFFEVLTSREAPGLGCGGPAHAGRQIVGRSCWLVVVPRGDVDADGTKRTADNVNRLDSSPLSQSNWDQRIVVKLDFALIGGACKIGTPELATAGQELVAEAITRWQPALCASTGRNFGYSQVSDDIARHQLGTDSPGLSFVSRPLGLGQLPPDRSAVYAPVALNGLVIAFNVDRITGIAAPPDVKAGDGARMPTLNLTARLVAKLLTQSYRWDVADDTTSLPPANPNEMTVDPDFLDLNPDFKPPVRLLQPGLSNLLIPFGQADGYRQIWDWVAADPEARAFLQGTPDPYGMVVNPNYEYDTLGLPRPDFPKADPYCQTFPDQPGQPHRLDLCTLDLHPYAADMHAAAQATSRGDPQLRTAWDPTAMPPSYRRGPPQAPGSRRMLALTDAATAARYNLPTARLRNADGQFVAPTPAGLHAGLAGMRPGAVGTVREPNPQLPGRDAYPLPTLTYATTVPASLKADERPYYAGFLSYAADAGQRSGLSPGMLPPGYAQLPATLRAQTRAVAKALLHYQPPRQGEPSTSDGGGAQAGGAGGAGAAAVGIGNGSGQGTGSGSGGSGTGSGPAGSATSAARKPGPSAAPAPAGPAPTTVTNVSDRRTPGLSVGKVRFALVSMLVLGGVAAGAGPALLRFATRSGR